MISFGDVAPLLARGLSFIPVKGDGKKAPVVRWQDHQGRPTTWEEATRWFPAAGSRNYGVALVMGVGGVQMVEVEGAYSWLLPGFFQELEERVPGLGDRLRACSAISPSGGTHFYFISDVTERNQALARAWGQNKNGQTVPVVMMETREAGGYAVVPPSRGECHPNGQVGWRFAEGASWLSLPHLTGGERAAVHEVARGFDEVEADLAARREEQAAARAAKEASRLQAVVGGSGGATQGTKPGEDFDARTGWRELLERYGWTWFGRAHGGGDQWTRPDKDVSDGLSATTGTADHQDRMFVFTTSTILPTEEPLTKFAVYAYYEHNGNFEAAAKELAAQGFGDQGSSVWVPPVERVAAVRQGVHQQSNVTQSDQNVTQGTHTVAGGHQEAIPGGGGGAATQAQAGVVTDPVLDAPPMPGQAPLGSPAVESPQKTLAGTDDARALDLVEAAEGTIRFCEQEGAWRVFDGLRWVSQGRNGGGVKELAKKVARQYDHSTKERLADKRRALSAGGMAAALSMAETIEGVPIGINEFDSNAEEVCTPDGILDLRSGQTRPAKVTDLHTLMTGVAPKEMDTPLWDAFLESSVPDKETRTWLQTLFGQALIGRVTEHIFPFFFGPGGNGKSVFLGVMSGVFGDYAAQTEPSFLMQDASKHETGVARLRGKRLVVSNEINAKQRFDEAKIKSLTGGDRQTARKMYQDFSEYEPVGLFVMAGNHKPHIEVGGDSFWRRAKLVDWAQKPENPIKGLMERIVEEEGPGVLQWLLDGAMRYLREGMVTPQAVVRSTGEYAAQTDTVGEFLEDRCRVAEPGDDPASMHEYSGVLYGAYQVWCRDAGEMPVNVKQFGQVLADKNLVKKRSRQGMRWLGVQIV